MWLSTMICFRARSFSTFDIMNYDGLIINLMLLDLEYQPMFGMGGTCAPEVFESIVYHWTLSLKLKYIAL